MKILICHERYEPDFGGGGEIVVHRTALLLRDLGHDVSVITSGDPSLRCYEDIPTQRLPISRYRFNLAAAKVAEAAGSADLIQTFNYHACLPALAAGRRTGKPVVCGVLGLFGNAWRDMRGPIQSKFYQAWERYLLCRPYTRIFFLSEFSRQLGLSLGVRPERTFVASPGVDTELFHP
ncbi:MAG: glycosyltransferase family 4 protein, partial [Woeseiaceae bacterium]|nr:glycosyltransferase family 4 protein [Woeseiaceae bacterium]